MKLVNVEDLKVLVAVESEGSIRYGKLVTDLFDDIPTVDAEPVKHGYWIFNPRDAIEAMFTLPKCSECGAESADGGKYCSNCGAKMDLEKENE